ncbi:Separase [Glycine soja]|uniref:Separase n=1 Tax=Glycine soja TaxID=3848 RepID=A0A445KEZ0_GLYSO|nr:hypothetical protein JHK87_016581 [Glycine soja]RZC09417.1 Separase [Glycine soja]
MDTITKVLPEECVATIISFTSPKDACQLSLVSPSFKEIADSEAVWANFLPSDCEDIIDQSSTPTLNLLSKKQIYAHLCDYHVLFDNGNMTLSLEKATGKKCIIGEPSESSLISKLQSSDSPGIHALVSDYPRPLSDLKPTKKSNPDQTLIRSLSKRFLSFLKASLSILPKWFPEVSKSNNAISLLELLCIYKLCLNCLDVIASQLASKPFSVKFQRLRLIHCLESCGLFDEAQLEGVGVLEKLPPTKRKGKLLPEIDKGNGEVKELCSLVVDIVVSLLRCVAAGLAKEDAHFRKVLQLVEEVNP